MPLTRTHSCYLVDLDNTIYDQDHYDQAVVHSSIADYNTLEGNSRIDTALQDQLVTARLQDRCTRDLFNTILLSHGFSVEEVTLYIRLYQKAASRVRVTLAPYQGCMRYLMRLKRKSTKIVLVTNGPIPVQRNKLECLHLNSMFDCILILDGNSGRKLKPSSEYVLAQLSSRYGLDGSDASFITVVGDNLATDMGLAKELGCKYFHPSELWHAA